MLKIINGFLVVLVLVAGAILYAMEHQTRRLERQIADTTRAISQTAEDIKLLSAEWSSLTRPERIQELASRHLKLAPAAATQYVSLNELAQRMAEVRATAAPADEKDMIGDLLQKMQ
jgi:cell division protein FtsL